MFKKSRSLATRALALTPIFFVIVNAADAQQAMRAGNDIVETIPNTVTLIGAFKNEAVIEADVVNERTPCKPNYPRNAIRNSETGTVKLQVLINVNGYASRSKVVETSGFRDLDRAAMIGFLGCKFKPIPKDGAPAETWVDMQYVWKIE
jgi:protein TonB